MLAGPASFAAQRIRAVMPWAPVALAAVLAAIALLGTLAWRTPLAPAAAMPLAAATASADVPAGASLPSLSGFTPEVQMWSEHILGWSQAYNLPPELIAVVMQIESCGHPQVRSPAGAIGLFQVMPFHFAAGEQPTDPEVNAARGLAYLARGLDLAEGDTRLALAGYNGGHGLIPLPPKAWPAETQRYVRWGEGILADLASGGARPTLQAWLAAGGARLCQRAAEQLGLPSG